MSSDIVERLETLHQSDHARLCQGREYSCTCGRDTEIEDALFAASQTIRALRKQCEGMASAAQDILVDCSTPDGRPRIPSGRKLMALSESLPAYRSFIGEKGR